jgi:hypothetical protein
MRQLNSRKQSLETPECSKTYQILALKIVRHDENEKKTYLDELHWPNGASLNPASNTSSRHWQKGIHFLLGISHD